MFIGTFKLPKLETTQMSMMNGLKTMVYSYNDTTQKQKGIDY